jgi:hypothetical protein
VHDAWAARTWWKRLFSWHLSVMEANAFRAYTKLGNHPTVSHREFINMLATQLMRNPFLGGSAARRSQKKKRRGGRGGSEDEAENDEPLEHNILKIHEHMQYGDVPTAQRSCNICRERTKFFCADCTDQSTSVGGVFLCGSTSGRQCIPIHIQRRMYYDHMM